TRSNTARKRCRSGTLSPSPATTSARPARPRPRSSPSRSRTAWLMWTPASSAACTSTTSLRACLSSSTRTSTSSRRSRSSAPLGGSYFVEALTDEMERQAEAYFKRIEEIGGVIPAIEVGFFQKEIADAAFRYQKELEQKRRIVIGVNDFKVDEEEPIDILRIDPKLESEQGERVREVRRKRDQAKCANALSK